MNYYIVWIVGIIITIILSFVIRGTYTKEADGAMMMMYLITIMAWPLVLTVYLLTFLLMVYEKISGEELKK